MKIDIYKKYNLVRIESDNPRKYTSLVFLFDRDDFLLDLKKARLEVGLNPLILYSRDEITLASPVLPMLPIYKKHIKTSDEVLKKIFDNSAEIATKLVEKYSRTPNFITPIILAIITGTVKDDDLNTDPEFRVIMPGRYKNESKSPELAMIFYPETGVEDVKKVFEIEKKKIFSYYQHRFFDNKRNTYDTISNIERDRFVYWLRKEKLSWKKLQDFIVPLFGDVSTRGLQLALSRYKRGLS